jgi:hypothetical protein
MGRSGGKIGFGVSVVVKFFCKETKIGLKLDRSLMGFEWITDRPNVLFCSNKWAKETAFNRSVGD